MDLDLLIPWTLRKRVRVLLNKLKDESHRLPLCKGCRELDLASVRPRKTLVVESSSTPKHVFRLLGSIKDVRNRTSCHICSLVLPFLE